MTKKRLILLDGHALLFRAYHAMPAFTAPDGRPSGAVYGFANVLVRVIRELEPTWLVTCFDAPGPTFREEVYPDYKATRAETPADLITQEPMTKEVVSAFGIPHLAVAGWEADDLIATLVEQAVAKSEVRNQKSEIDQVIIVTGDRDLLQLSQPKVKIYLLRSSTKEIVLLDEADVTELIGVPPTQLLEWKALRGDPSDNISGVPGVGDKTALILIKEFGTLERLYQHVESGKSDLSAGGSAGRKISDWIVSNLLAYKERAFQNRELLTVRTDAPVTLDLVAAHHSNYQPVRARTTLGQFGFKGILSRLPDVLHPAQPGLFGEN